MLLLRELWHSWSTPFGLTFLARSEDILAHGEFLKRQGAICLGGTVDHNVVKGVLILVVTDDQVRAGHPVCSEGRKIMLFDDKEMPQMEKAQLVVQRIRISVHPAVTNGAFPVWAMVIFALIRILGVLVEVEVVVEEVPVHRLDVAS